ncbi:MAG: 8-oxo-dGTP diphosphatase [Bacilli bacterium]
MKKEDKYSDYKKIYTNMCMIYKENGEILVEERIKSDWPGLTFPGGHINDGEDLIEATKREVFEETNLIIDNVEYVDEIVWINEKKKTCEIALLYRTNTYEGELKSSEEGPVFFIHYSDYKKYPLSTDFERVLDLMLNKPTKLF